MRIPLLTATLLGTLLLSSTTMASSVGHWGMGAKVGTLGKGFELLKPINPATDVRLGLNQYTFDDSESLDDTNYDIKLDMETFSAIIDFRPMHSGFFISAGAMKNKNALEASATATAGDPIELGGVSLSNGTVNAEIRYDEVSPYVGIGYRTQSSSQVPGWGVTAELGILIQEDPEIMVSESTGMVPQSEIDQEIDNIREDLDFLKKYPVASIGVVYTF